MSTWHDDAPEGPRGPERIIAGLSRIQPALGWVSAAGLIAAVVAVLTYAPVEAYQGMVQKIFYFHVPSAWVGFLGVGTVALASALLLLTRDRGWDEIAAGTAEVTMVFLTIVLVTGPLWAKPIWGTWWTWDARLTSFFVLWLIYAGYLLVRPLADESERGARIAAVLAILGALNVPIIHFSVLWWRTLHPKPVIVNPEEGAQAPPEMVQTLLFCLAVWTVMWVYLVARRVALEHRRHLLEAPGDTERGDGPGAGVAEGAA